MIDDKYIDLIDKEIDGGITPEERGVFHAYLAQNAEVRNLYEEQFHTSVLLNKVTQVKPPVDLVDRILKSIDVNHSAPQWPVLPYNTLDAKLVYTFIFGTIAGILFHILFF